jgi:N-acetylglucosamine kinase-like BadF-type ATPase
MLNDEGSGSWIGKRLLKDFFYLKMPKHLSLIFSKNYKLTEVLDKIYKQNYPNRFLASVSAFAISNRNDPYIIDILEEGFNFFINQHIKYFKEWPNVPIHFIGGIAWHYRDILFKCMDAHGLQKGIILERPGENLLKNLSNLNN